MAQEVRGGWVGQKRRAEEREAHWRGVLAEWARSGRSQAGFCEERGLSAPTFSWWKRELARRDAARSGRRGQGEVKAGGGPRRHREDQSKSRRLTRHKGIAAEGPALVPVRVVGLGRGGWEGAGGNRLASSAHASEAAWLREVGEEGAGLEVVLGNGRRIRVGAGVEAAVLARVVLVLEGVPC